MKNEEEKKRKKQKYKGEELEALATRISKPRKLVYFSTNILQFAGN